MLLAAISACHKLWFLHLACEAGLVVIGYVDEAEGVMVERPEGGRFEAVTLHPEVTLRGGYGALIPALHVAAHHAYYLANSITFPVHILQ